MPNRELPGRLVLRTATPADLPRIADLLVQRGDSADARDLELMVTDPDSGWDLCAVVVDGDEVVSTASLMDEQIRIGGVTLPAGQVELVATRIGYEGRGLVRELMQRMHQLSTARGHLLQVMIGIPYFYRLFGYEYAITIPKARAVIGDPPESWGDSIFRPATAADLTALEELQEQAQRSFDVTVAHSPARRRWLLSHDSSITYVLERHRRAVGTARVQTQDSAVLLAEGAAVDEEAADALLAEVCRIRPGVPVTVVDRIGTVASTAWATRLDEPDRGATQYYVRIADPGPLLDALRPLLFRRLTGSEVPIDGVVISTFGRHYRMAVESDGLGAVRAGGAMQAPCSAGGAGVAPDQLGALLFGPLGMAGLTTTRPDVYPGPHRELFEALFPPLTADLLTFYLPY
ncbi:GNAT family N-acetyltransferase [Nakamurella sp. UYEF19]|uniref:GNAT family N-acetyltransferase n=1 Tax=Nakamurella sp. UYEF19 TaxID=1756392 RepID=UPI003397D8B1